MALAEIAVNSLLSQGGESLEVRIYLYVDGPVSNECEEFIQCSESHFYKVIRGEKNRGLAFGLNRLIDNLESEEYVFRMDLDDVNQVGRFSAQIDFIENHQEYDLVGCNISEIDQSGQWLRDRAYPETYEECMSVISKGMPILHPTFCFRRSLFLDPSIRYPDKYLTEDLALLSLLIRRGVKFGNVQNNLFSWRLGDEFYKRRNIRRSKVELFEYVALVYFIYGFSFRLIWPILRFAFRFFPGGAVKFIYGSRVKKALLKG